MNPDNITDVHGTPVHDDLACESDCMNCGEHVDESQMHVILSLVDKAGTLETLERWAICVDCGAQPASILAYVKASL